MFTLFPADWSAQQGILRQPEITVADRTAAFSHFWREQHEIKDQVQLRQDGGKGDGHHHDGTRREAKNNKKGFMPWLHVPICK